MDTTHRSSFSSPSVCSNVKNIIHVKKTQLALAVSALVAGLGGMATPAFAGPEGGVVTGGSGTISQSGSTTTINQSTDLMAIDWNSFDVGADETVQYIQPDASSVSLNRILSNNGSVIQGQIDANGQVILVNPHGIIFTATSVINAGGILASGLTIDTSEFMNGDFAFEAVEGTDGVVINSGLLNAATGGSVNLLGKQVINDGLIQADLGRVSLAAGNAAVVSFDTDGLIGITVTESVLQEELGVDPAILNTGDISAAGGKVLISAAASRDIFSAAVNTDDLRQATSVVMDDDGGFTLSAGANVVNTGTIDVSVETASTTGGSLVILGENIEQSGIVTASSALGDGGNIEIHSVDTTLIQDGASLNASSLTADAGDIKILGSNVGLLADTTVEATGATNGGEVLIGGDYRGENNLIPTATAVYFDREAVITANATESGSAGKVILWGDDSLKAYGDISAAGFSLADGGFVETSAGVVNLDLLVNTSSEMGEGGEWLVDPYNITITDGDDDGEFDFGNIFLSENEDSEITANSIVDGLSSRNTIIIETGDDGPDIGGNITLSTDLDFDSIGTGTDKTLILNAHNDIILNGQIYDSNTNDNESLNLTLNADFDSNGSGSVDINNIIELNGGDFIASGVNFDLGFQDTEMNISGSSINTDGGDISLFMSGDINIYDDINTGNGSFQVSGYYDYDYEDEGDGDESNDDVNDATFYQATSFSSYFAADADADADADAGTSEVIATILTGNNITIDAATVNLGNIGNDTNNVGGVNILNSDDDASMSVSLNGDIYSDSDVTITGTGSADTIVVSGQVNQTLTINSGGGSDELTFNSVNTLNATSGGGNDTININANVSGSISGGDSNDVFNISASIGTTSLIGEQGNDTFKILSANISAVIDGGDSTTDSGGAVNNNIDTIVGFNVENEWNVTDLNKGTLINRDEITSLESTILFEGISKLQGGSESDTFNIGARLDSTQVNGSGFVQGTIDGGEGSDTFNIDIESFGDDDTVTLAISGGADVDSDDIDIDIDIFDFGFNSNAEWLITGANEGTLNTNVSFSQVETLNGSDGGNDTFDIEFANADVATTLGSFAGNIDGRGGDDTIELTYSTNGTEATDAVIDLNTISNLEYLKGGDDDGVATQLSVIGIEDTTTMWEILDFDNGGNLANGVNDGRITYGTTGSTESIEFIDIGNLVGTAGIDTFTVTGSIVSIDGSENDSNTLTGSDIENTWIVDSANGGSLAATNDETNPYVTTFSNIDTLVGGSDVDTFILSSNEAALSLDGGGNTDIVRITHDSVSIWTLDGVDEKVTANNNEVSLVDIETAEGSDTANDTFNISYLTTNFTNFTNFTSLNGRGGNEDTLNLSSIDTELTWTLGDDSQTVNVSGNSISFEFIESLIGSDAFADTFNYSVNPTHIITAGDSDGDILSVANVADDIDITISDSNGFNGIEQYIGNNDGSTGAQYSTTLTFESNNNEIVTWNVNGVNDGDITNAITAETIQFVNVNNLTGGAGNDTFDFTNTAASITGTINGAGGSNILNAKNVATVWTIDEANGGSLDNTSSDIFVNIFENIQTINAANTTTDTFNVSAAFNTINGDANDFLIIDADNEVWELTGAGAGSTSTLANFTGITNLTGNGGNDTLIGIAQDNTWTIDEEDSGTVTGTSIVEGVSVANNFTFSGMENLAGNTGSDDFTITTAGSIAGTISGTHSNFADAGTDTLTIESLSTENITWTLAATGGSATGVNSFDTFEAYTGGAGSDTFELTVNTLETTLDGAGGSDTVSVMHNTATEWALGITTDITAETVTSANNIVTLNNIEIAQGSNTQTDTFTLNSATTSFNELQGRGGDDDFVIVTADVKNITLDGGAAGTTGDSLSFADVASAINWNLGDSNTVSANTGTLTFSNMESLLGSNSGVDTFDFSVLSSLSVDGGMNDGDIYDVADVNGNVVITVGDEAIAGIERYIGNQDGLSGSDNNTTLIFESSETDSVVWNVYDLDGDVANGINDDDIDGINDGDINDTIQFVNVNNLIGGDGNDAFIFDNTVTTASGAVGLSGTIDGGAGSNSLTAANLVNTWVINDGNGSGTLTYLNGFSVDLETTTSFANVGTLNSGDQNDTFTLHDATATLTLNAGEGEDNVNLPAEAVDITVDITLDKEIGGISLNDFETITANANFTNIFRVSSVTDDNVEWDITGVNTGEVIHNGVVQTQFVNFDELIGNAGNDTFDFTNANANITGTINGAGGSNTIIAKDVATVWTIDEINGGNLDNTSSNIFVNAFENIQIINAENTTADIFNVSAAFNTIHGDEFDTLNVNGTNTIWQLATSGSRVEDDSGSLVASFNGITNIGGTGDNDTLIGIAQDNTWTIDAADSGTVTGASIVAGVSVANNFIFSGMENLAGNSGSDDFTITTAGSISITGTLSGTHSNFIDAGTDTLTIESLSEDAIVWTLTANGGSTTGRAITFNAFEVYTGGAGVDVFELTVDSLSTILDGAGGTDTVSVAHNTTTEWALGTTADITEETVTSGSSVVTLNNIEIAEGSDSAIDTFTILSDATHFDILRGRGEDDMFIVDSALLPTMTLDGGDSGSDSLSFVDVVESITWTLGDTQTVEATSRLITFEGIQSLMGSDFGADTFNYITSSSTSLSTHIIDAGDGGFTDILSVAGVIGSAEIIATNGSIERYVGNQNGLDSSSTNSTTLTFLGGNDVEVTWNIKDFDDAGTVADGINDGDINGIIQFVNVNNLTGGDGNDTFSFFGSGNLSGFINGGDQPEGTFDAVDFSGVTSAINVVVGDALSGYINIEQYIGNNRNAQFTAADFANTWTINGENSGSLTYIDNDLNANTIFFSGFSLLTGGSLSDEFTLEGLGTVTGSIHGALGDDSLLLGLASGRDGEVTFHGGEGNNTMTLSGGNNAERFDADYQPLSDGSALLDFTRESSTFSVNYDGVATLNNDVFIQTLTVTPIVGADNTMTLSGNDITDIIDIAVIDNTNDIAHTVVSNSQTNSLTIDGGANDAVVIDGVVALADTLTLKDVFVATDTSSHIQASTLIFDRTSSIGSAEQHLTTDVQTLELMSIDGDTYLNNDGDLDLAALTSPVGVVDLSVNGNVTSSSILSSSNDLAIQSTSDITLNTENNITGDVSLFATNGGIVFNNGVTHLAGIETRVFDLTVRGAVDSSGPIIVTDLTTLIGTDTSDFLFDQAGNDFSRVELVSGRNVTLTNNGSNGDSELSVFGATSGVVDIETDTSLLLQRLTADSVLANTAGSIDIDDVDVVSTIALNASQDIVFGDISASNINVAATNDLRFTGDVSIVDSTTDTVKAFTAQAGEAFITTGESNITSVADSNAFDLRVTSNTLSLAGTINTLEADAEFDFSSSANVSNTQSFATLIFGLEDAASVGQVTMSSAGELITTGDLNLASGGDLLLGRLVSDATVTLSVNGQVIDNNASGEFVTVSGLGLENSDDLFLNDLTSDAKVSLSINNSAVNNDGIFINNITAKELISYSTTGFGTFADNIETSVEQLSIVNLTNDIAILNDRAVDINALINKGNILLQNTSGTVTINNNSDADDYIKELTGTEAALGVIDGGYDTGFVSILVDDGALVVDGDLNFERPDLVALTSKVATTEGFGTGSRPLLLWINESITVEGNGFLPFWFENDVADFFTTGDFIDTSLVVNSADLLIEVEPITEVDPAIFSNVLNYEYGELSIRLPNGQLFDELYDDEETWVSGI